MRRFASMVMIGTLGAALPLHAAHAEETDRKIFSFSGFGTVGIAHSGNKEADFTSNANFHPNGAGYSRSWSANVDSILGVQVDAAFTDRLSGVVQVITKQNYDNSHEPRLEWANIAYKLTPNLRVRLGRTLWPMMLRSETQNIGYGNPFVRNSTELIANMPNSSSDGVDATYQFITGSFSHATTVLAGKSDNHIPGESNTGPNFLNISKIRGISHVMETDELKVHAAYLSMTNNALVFNTPLVDVSFKTATLGFNYDRGAWFVTGDFLKAWDQAFGKATAFTVGGGVRFGDFSPYLTYSSLRQDSLGESNAGNVGDKQTVSAIGVRWDIKRNMDVKVQYEKVKSGPIAQLFPSSLTNVQPGFFADPKVNVVSIVFDFVF